MQKNIIWLKIKIIKQRKDKREKKKREEKKKKRKPPYTAKAQHRDRGL